MLNHTKILHFGSLSLVEEPIRAAAKEAVDIVKNSGGKISLDVNYRPTLWDSAESAYREVMSIVPKINMLKVNEDELVLLSGLEDLEAGSGKLIEIGPEVVVVTLGPRGSYFRTANRRGHVPGFRVKTVDATGCGDAFIAGVLTRLVEVEGEGQEWKDADWGSILRFGNGVGALTARTLGVIPALPKKQEVADFLTKNEGQRVQNNE